MAGMKLNRERSSCTAQTRKQYSAGVLSPTGGPSRQRMGKFRISGGARCFVHCIETDRRPQTEEMRVGSINPRLVQKET
jgi:hypothetical protein